MNSYKPLTDVCDVNMTSKGQVLIPKNLRDRAGLTPGKSLAVGMNDRGEVVVMSRQAAETVEQRRARIREALESMRGTLDTGFASTDEYMDFIRPHRHDPL
jgi:bifunctional DNA-binding transcriptional regulator/antitoxin component of YhaV-PrlF toxin-antitoxin module